MLTDRLRRITSDGNWISEVDGLRFIAISSVFLFHLNVVVSAEAKSAGALESTSWWLGQLLVNGNRGVSLFFVISGMILALPFARQYLTSSKPVSLRKYYMRRVTRLEPPYILSLLIATVMVAIYYHGLSKGIISDLLASLIYQHSSIFGTLCPINWVLWSLEIEIQFYVLAPLVMQCFRITGVVRRRAVILVCIAVVSLAQIPFQDSHRFSLSLLYFLQYFLMGMVVADVFIVDLKAILPSWKWDLVGIAALASIFWPESRSAWTHAFLPIPEGLLCISAMRSLGLRRILANRWVAVIGGMCYSIYLLHLILISAVSKVTRVLVLPAAPYSVNYAIQLLITGIPVVLLCVIFYVMIERPCMNPNWPTALWQMLTARRGNTKRSLAS